MGRNVVVNGSEIEAPDRVNARQLATLSGVGTGRALAVVEDGGTLRRLSEGEVLDPESSGVYTSIPDFRYGY